MLHLLNPVALRKEACEPPSRSVLPISTGRGRDAHVACRQKMLVLAYMSAQIKVIDPAHACGCACVRVVVTYSRASIGQQARTSPHKRRPTAVTHTCICSLKGKVRMWRSTLYASSGAATMPMNLHPART